jgi:hypothetical protein
LLTQEFIKLKIIDLQQQIERFRAFPEALAVRADNGGLDSKAYTRYLHPTNIVPMVGSVYLESQISTAAAVMAYIPSTDNSPNSSIEQWNILE